MLKRLEKKLYEYLGKLFWLFPARYRNQVKYGLYLTIGPLLKGMPDYNVWKNNRRGFNINSQNVKNMIAIDQLDKCRKVNGSIAIHIHLYYPDTANEFYKYLKNMPFAYDLYISVTDRESKSIAQRTFSSLELMSKLSIELVPNRGRDIAPMFCSFGGSLESYSFIAHLHSKKSLYTKGATEGWREYLGSSLLGSKERIQRIFTALQDMDPKNGIVYPQNYNILPYMANTWLGNRSQGLSWCSRLGIQNIPNGYFDYPVGSMFWARGDALKPLFDAGITLDDFPEEKGQTDGTLAHCLERMLALSSQKQGYLPAIIKSNQANAWSAWGFHNYVARSFELIASKFSDPAFKVIGFDIFDTLLSRPLLDPELTKVLIAEQFPGQIGELYLLNRPVAEMQARTIAGRDVGLSEIYKQLSKLTSLPEETIGKLRTTEEEIEKASLSPRSEVLALFHHALATKKPVVLISDMFLPRAVIEEALLKHGITDWGELFLSNEIGLRKDTGELYQYVLQHFGIAASDLLMVGDNERSDWQIPHDMGAGTIHILKPVELARGLPRMRKLIETYEKCGDLNKALTMGLVVQHNFSSMTFPEFDPDSLVQPTPFNIGYSVVGPLLAGFSQWLVNTSLRDGAKELFFLAREGQIMKQAYDLWTDGLDETPSSRYLVLSRRTLSVPMIKDFNDIIRIASSTYVDGSIDQFLHIRFGLQLDIEIWQHLDKNLGWPNNRRVKVIQQEIDHLLPLLKELEPKILTRSRLELEGLSDYIKSIELGYSTGHALVDIGYGGTAQSYLNSIVKKPINGYYMITDLRSKQVAEEFNVIIRGCFAEMLIDLHDHESSGKKPILANMSFDLEKLLSSNEPQIIHYTTGDGNCITPLYQLLTDKELLSSECREEIQDGALKFIHDAVKIRKNIYKNFEPCCEVANRLFDELAANRSINEMEVFQKIRLDDFYCGRGVV